MKLGVSRDAPQLIVMKLEIRVTTNALQQRVEVFRDNSLKVWVKSQPSKGRANQELISFLEDLLGDESQPRITSGASSHKKLINVNRSWEEIKDAVKFRSCSSARRAKNPG